MTSEHFTTGITNLAAEPGAGGQGLSRWRVSFESSHADCCHQLYANGKLIAWTDGPPQRSFTVDSADVPHELVVVACSAEARSVDATGALGLSAVKSTWRCSVIPGASSRLEDRIEVLDEDQQVVASGPLWPMGVPLWSFGYDTFGLGGFGFDGRLAPGLGHGSFGAGELGFDCFCTAVELPLQTEGEHSYVVRVSRDGALSPSLGPFRVMVAPPPAPAKALRWLSYDAPADRVTFEIER